MQDLAVETLRKIHEGFRPELSWNAWLWWLLPKRMTDRTREHELVMLEALAATDGNGTPDVGQLPLRKPAATPSEAVSEGERRSRQLKLLSDVFREFCREHEQTSSGRKRKEMFERGLRGQKRSEIVTRMSVARGTVDRYLGEAFAWILDRALRADVNRTVFLALRRP